MEAELVEKLSRINEFSDELINILTAIIRDIHRNAWDTHTSRLAVILVNFTCQPKISYMRKSPSATITVNNAKKTLEDYCMDLILQLLLKLLKLKDDMVHKLTELFLEMIEMNINNVDTIILLYRVMFFSEKVVNYVLDNNYLGIFIEQYKKIITQILKEFDSSDRSTFVSETLRNYFYGGSDFYSNLSKHLQSIGSSSPFESSSHNNPNIQEEEYDSNTQSVVNYGQIHNEPHNNQPGTNNPSSEQSSFFLPPGHTINHGNKSVKIPILNLPASFNENNKQTISRSTRRAELYKSFNTNSNRLSNLGGGSNSVDYGAKDIMFQRTNLNDNEISIPENENSYVFEGDLNKIGVEQSSLEKMKHLANQLGEYCLTIDLGCLLAQNRKIQLDRVAKVAVYQDVDTIMDFKAEEKILREKFRKKKHKTNKKTKIARKSIGLGLGLNPEIKEVESSENSENESDGDGQGGKDAGGLSPQKSPSVLSAERSDKQASRNRKMQELKQNWKAGHVMSNILFLLLKEVDYEKLQQYGSLINILYLALSTDISKKFRQKEKMKLALNLNYWIDTMDDEFNKHEELCEGIDNVESINRHLEKTLIEKHKQKQVRVQQTTTPNNATPGINLNTFPGSANNAGALGHMGHQNIGNHPNISTYGSGQNLSNHPGGQASLIKSNTINNNDSKKKGTLPQKSMTLFDVNATNMKYFDSTVLHFSTTYDYTNSSAITAQDESIGFLDELNTYQNLMNLNFILLPENLVYFKILDLFSVVSEKVHETLCTKYQSSFELDRIIDEPSVFSETNTPVGPAKHKNSSDKEKILDIGNLVTRYPGDAQFKIFIKGLYMNPAEEKTPTVIKRRANLFLHKYEKKLTWILNQVDMNSPYYYDMIVEQLEILDGYLDASTSKIAVLEVIDNSFELLLLIKKQILDLSSGFLSGQTTRLASPTLTAKVHRTGSMTRDLPILSAPASSTNVANNILKSVLKVNPSPGHLANPEFSPKRRAESDKDKGRLATIFVPSFTNSFIYKQKDFFTTYLGIIAKLIAHAPNSHVYGLLNEVFVSNESWTELVKLFTTSIFREIMMICEKIGDSNEILIEKDQISLFIHAKKILEYYTSVLVMCNTTIYKEKLNTSPIDLTKKKWKATIRRILQTMFYLVKQSGILTNYISVNTNLNSTIISPNIQSLSNYNLMRIHLFKAIYDFLKKIFSFDNKFSCFLGEEITTFYIRFSYINFVKLYSYSSNAELNEINRKITEIGNRVKSKAGQDNLNENIDRLENEFNRRNPKSGNNELKTYQIHLSKLYMKVLLTIAKNRTDDIKRKFYQYKILEFFTREIDLEFDINQIRERFMRIRNETKSMVDKKNQSFPQRRSQYNVGITPEEPDEESKERQDTGQSDMRITNLSDAGIPFNAKKLLVGGLQPRLVQSHNPTPYLKDKSKTIKVHDPIFTIEEASHQKSYTSEDIMNTHVGQTLPNATDILSLKNLQLHNNQRTKSTPFEKEEASEDRRLGSHVDLSPALPLGDSHFEENAFEHSNISNENRSPHLVFQKKRLVPSLNLVGHQSSSYYTGGGSVGASPLKGEYVPKTLFEAESEMHQEEKKVALSLQHTLGSKGKRKSQIEQISGFELSDTRTPSMIDKVAQLGHNKSESTIQNKFKGVIQQDGFKEKQEPKLALRADGSSQRKVRASLASISSTEKPIAHSKRKIDINEMPQKETLVLSLKRTVSKREASDKDKSNQTSSKRSIGSKMSPMRALKIEFRPEDGDNQKRLQTEERVEEQKVEHQKPQLQVLQGNILLQGGAPGVLPTPIQTDRTDEISDISMGEMIQREMEYKKALAEQQKGKKPLPSLKLPSFLTEKGHMYGVDAKYAGSPREVQEHSDKEEEKENSKASSSFKMNESIPFQSNQNAAGMKKFKVPSLKIAGLGKEEGARPLQEEQEKAKENYTFGNFTGSEQSLNASQPQKMQLILENKKKNQSPTMNLKNLTKESPLIHMDEVLTENLFYYSERKLRKIYEDDELHVLVISLMISLLLTPERGTLDEHYTSQYPIDDGKPNILYIMHFHLNHPSNQHILPLLLQKMAEIPPYPAGQRLLKLLCISFSDMSIYTDKKKIGGGAYGTIFECNTNLADPRTVAIKETKFPTLIQDRCVLHDIFTEITCLEQFRLDPVVTDIYDYGVTESSYMIVMKKYPFSLKEWRNKQEGSWMENLPTYLTIYKDILKAVSMLHTQNITHYDIKADNILLDFKSNNTMKWNSDSDIRVVLADFGECKMFTNELDELCVRNRGTANIKSPEMLTLTINCKREADNYDRRRKVGTTRSSDIWSLGCLLYEILTGEYLFNDADWASFFRITSQNEVLLTEERLSKIDHNIYIVDFLKYILVREPQHRPSISNVLKRFEHIHAILVSNMNSNHQTLNLTPHSAPSNHISLKGTLESYVELLFMNQEAIQEKVTIPHKLKHPPTYIKIMDEISMCSRTYFLTNADKLIRNRVTHVITTSNLIEERYLSRFRYMLIHLTDDQKLHMLPYILAPQLMDYLKTVFLYKGNILFVEDDNININSKPSKLVLRTALLFCLTHFFKSSVFETWTLINSQVLFFSLPFSHLSMMINLMVHYTKLSQFVSDLPKIQCICGCCTILLKRQFGLEKNVNIKSCVCSRESKTIEFSDCPSDGCHDYVKYIKDKFGIQWESLKWGYFNQSDFFVGPKGTGVIQDKFHSKIILTSEGVQENSTIYHKKSTRRKTAHTSPGNKTKDKWDLYQCKFCMMWLFAENKAEQRYAVLMNNKQSPKEGGIMMPQIDQKIQTPTLRNFKLSDLR